MYLEIYPDIIFILNFLLDLILLYILKRVNRKSASLLRLAGAAATGAISAVFVSIFPWMNVVLRFVIMNVAASIIMMLIAFGRMKKAELIKQVISFYLITYSVGGLMNSIYYHTNMRIFLMDFGNALVFSNISWRFVAFTALLLLPLSVILLWLSRWYQSMKRETYEVELFMEDRSIHTTGLMDTGNCLHDPVFGKPVMVIEDALMKDLLSPEFQKDVQKVRNYMEKNDMNRNEWDIGDKHAIRFRFIPYQSIGKTQGMMLGLMFDKVLIHTGKETVCNEKVTAAICDNHLSTKDDYHVILHKELI